jgi:mono/diheme cytochrome c family protein|tara:strand:- start:5856 stop:6251 length:396 start_codon:yes stop_codon:yes gene_type:complete
MVRVRTVAGLIASLAIVQPAVAQEQNGQSLYETNCASCHGAQLEGQPDWMSRLPNGRLPAPPHDETGHTWHHSDAQLFRIVKEGLGAIAPGYETDMPAFADRMSDDEIRAVIDYIKTTWPDRESDIQRSRS